MILLLLVKLNKKVRCVQMTYIARSGPIGSWNQHWSVIMVPRMRQETWSGLTQLRILYTVHYILNVLVAIIKGQFTWNSVAFCRRLEKFAGQNDPLLFTPHFETVSLPNRLILGLEAVKSTLGESIFVLYFVRINVCGNNKPACNFLTRLVLYF